MDRQEIFRICPLLEPSGSERFLVIGDDLDSYLSAMMFIKHHPAARIIGFYQQYTNLFLLPDYRPLLPHTVWLDLDIYNNECRSAGHHMLRSSPHDVLNGLNNSVNCNELRGIGMSQFTRKYPLGTIHFLFSLYDERYVPGSDAELLYWLADSTYINGQSHKFRDNVGDWIVNFLQHDLLEQTFSVIDTVEFEERMKALHDHFRGDGLQQGNGQAESKHLHQKGFQFQHTFNEKQQLEKTFSMLSHLTGLPDLNLYFDLHVPYILKRGVRSSTALTKILDDQAFDAFLRHHNVFSYAIVKRNRLNYTAGITL